MGIAPFNFVTMDIETRSALERALLESEQARQESEALRELVAKLLGGGKEEGGRERD